MLYEKLLSEAYSLGIDVYEEEIRGNIKGLYADNVIWIDKHLPSYPHKYCILAEEIGHHHRTTGNILNQKKVVNVKQEMLARLWAYERLIPLYKIIEGHHQYIRNKHEFADFLGVTEEFLEAALQKYKEKYGHYVDVEGYRIIFDPLGVVEWFEEF
ncbi:ImmA/IrrE family metallo-endopeptidase [Salimicrobium halophilum]|uniref:IrrE N-terminal-like domain-containing protein n=1 Tax=Salimicrobium halophilum TaxID=86666 RepID=A0A1G8WH54_9BACI|nr:ImmA/IrrE family metallo-endopeptidase [Salimicrobium halophilum]SDJ76995.1 protein of unknown function [Salimicrobium halophilum]